MNTPQTPSRTDFQAQTRFLTLASVVDNERLPTGRLRTIVLLSTPPADEREPDINLRSVGSGVVGQARRQFHLCRAAQRQQLARAVGGSD